MGMRIARVRYWIALLGLSIGASGFYGMMGIMLIRSFSGISEIDAYLFVGLPIFLISLFLLLKNPHKVMPSTT